MNKNSKEIQLLYIQIYTSLIFIIAVLVSIILTYDEILKKSKKKRFFNNKTSKDITLINRIVLTIITIVFTYISYEAYLIGKEKNESNIPKKELIASILTLIAAFILLNSTIENINKNENSIDIDTPLI